MPEINILASPDWKDYTLLDSGNGLKLERFGRYTFVRPEVQALWAPSLPASRWEAAEAVFQPTGEESGGHWLRRKPIPEQWEMVYGDLRFTVMTTPGRHLGVFPECAAHWDWMGAQIASERKASNREIRVLNLFGYTGLATLAAARAGAQVTHVDASPKVIAWARQNQELSGLVEKPVRWIVDDALKFVQREARRNALYDGLILDPPKFGRGPKGEVWEFYRLLPELLQACSQVLPRQPAFLVLTAYAIQASALTIYNAMAELLAGRSGDLTTGELISIDQSGGRYLSHAIFVRWKSQSIY